ncbi:MAG: Asp23/Gls24 family envelope stress response protein [Victivallales bacterium]|nr:Asp23/Gls24 family envelope stress response protein [Victivallales bacterium]
MKPAKKKKSTVQGAVSAEGNELGLIHIHENVIAAAVRMAAGKVAGVVRLAGSPLVNNIAELIGNKTLGDRSIAVQIDGEAVSLDVKVNIAYGAHVPTVASNLQSAIVGEVEKITGMTVTGVNVLVQELDDPEAQEEEEE